MLRSLVPVFALALIAMALLATSPAHASMRANYEVSLSANGQAHNIQTAETLALDQAITQELGEYVVKLLPVIGADGNYTLQVTVTSTPKESSGIAPEVTLSFPGTLSGPMDFTAQFGDAQVSGALMLRHLEE